MPSLLSLRIAAILSFEHQALSFCQYGLHLGTNFLSNAAAASLFSGSSRSSSSIGSSGGSNSNSRMDGSNVNSGTDGSTSVALQQHDPAVLDLAGEKRAVRQQLRRALRAMSAEERQRQDAAIQHHVLQSDWFSSARRVCGYISCSALREVATTDLLHDMMRRGVAVYLPRVLDKESNMAMLRVGSLQPPEVESNEMNILEPTLFEAPTAVEGGEGRPRENVLDADGPLDLLLLPGLAFDHFGGRLGRGGGYYDKFLSSYLSLVDSRGWRRPRLAALAYSQQLLDFPLPMGPLDMKVDALVSEQGVVEFKV